MHFIDTWTSLAAFDLLFYLAPPAIAIVAMLIPGRGVARLGSLAMAAAAALSPDIGSTALRVAWLALWLGVALFSGVRRDLSWRGEGPRPGGVESGMVGLLLSAALLVLLIVALGRQDLPPELTRPTAIGLLLVVAGLAHLMLRRDSLRGAMAFATVGFGLHWLDRAMRQVVLEAADVPEPAVLFATALVVALATRVALVRQHDAGSAWISFAHDLHD